MQKDTSRLLHIGLRCIYIALFMPFVLGCSSIDIQLTHSQMRDSMGVGFVEKVLSVGGIGRYLGYSSQGLAIYGKYAIITYDTGFIQVLDYERLEIVGSYAMPDVAHHRWNHAGMANFGALFYKDNDMYVSSYQENKCYVLRVDLHGAEIIQEIQMANSWHYFVDDEMNLIVRLYNNDYYVFELPSIYDRDVVLEKENAKSCFKCNLENMQYAGAICKDNRLLVLCYYRSAPAGVRGRFDRIVEFDYCGNLLSQYIFKDSRIRTHEFEGLSETNNGDLIISFVADQLAILSQTRNDILINNSF